MLGGSCLPQTSCQMNNKSTLVKPDASSFHRHPHLYQLFFAGASIKRN
jgi:hypothetical protein